MEPAEAHRHRNMQTRRGECRSPEDHRLTTPPRYELVELSDDALTGWTRVDGDR